MEYYIPSNFEDNGKIAGLFGIRNVIEAGLLSLPFVYLSFTLVPGGLTWKTIAAAVFAIPTGGTALLVRDIKNGIVILKDGRYIKICEMLPVNFYLKSEGEQENEITMGS